MFCVGVEADDEKINALIAEMKGKKLEEVIAAGTEKMSSVPAAPAAGAAAPAAGGAAKEEKKAEPESESESDEEMGFGLFD